MTTDAIVDFEALHRCEPVREPFAYAIVPHFVLEQAQPGIEEDYPRIAHPGSFPLQSLRYGPRFKALIDALTGPDMTALVEDKLAIDLSGRPVTVTVRGVSRASDGRIHTDSKSKLVTLLLYMNREWESGHGRLRLLRTSDTLTDYVAEVPPDEGTLLLFKNGANAWHGFEAFEGPRRVIQVNWVTDEGVVRRESSRHRFSAAMKRLFGAGQGSPYASEY